MSRGNRRMANIIKNDVYILLWESTMRHDDVIPIPKYKISKQVIMSTHILSKYKIKKSSSSGAL